MRDLGSSNIGSRSPARKRTSVGLVLCLALLTVVVLGAVAGPAQAVDDYPYRDYYGPGSNPNTSTWYNPQGTSALSPLGFPFRNSTDFVAFRLNQQMGGDLQRLRFTWSSLSFPETAQSPNGDGTARGWRQGVITTYGSDRANGTPTVGSVAWWGPTVDNPFGHVAIVAAVNPNGTVDVEEYNRYNVGAWGARSGVTADSYLHIADTPQIPGGAGGDSATSFVLDVSNSMDEAYGQSTKLEAAKGAAKAIVDVLNGYSVQSGRAADIGVAAFSDLAESTQELTDNYAAVNRAIDSLATGGGANMIAGIQAGMNQLNRAMGGSDRAIFLLSDGNDTSGNSRNQILDKAREAGAMGIRINTIGFGVSGGASALDEQLLRDIADVTGGVYSLGDPAVAPSLVGKSARGELVRSGASIILEQTGQITQGDTVAAGVASVPNETGQLQVVLAWLGSELDIRLTDPSGRIVDATYPGYSATRTGRVAQGFVENPMRGDWSVAVYGRQVTRPAEPFYVLAGFRGTGGGQVGGGQVGGIASPPVVPGSGGSAGSDNSVLWLGLFGLALAGGVAWILLSRSRPQEAAGGPAPWVRQQPLGVSSPGAGVLIESDGTTHRLKAGSNSLGRAGYNDVVLADERASRSHAVLMVEGTLARIRDVGSGSGTMVNGARVYESILEDGDRVTCGATTLVFHHAGSE